jgi:opacity protein-like surface antigen
VDAGFGQSRYSQNYSGAFGAEAVQSNFRQIATDFLLHIPDHSTRIHPYGLVGVGAFRFNPTSNVNNALGAATETRSALVYGGGADFDISKSVGIRAEYRGSRFRMPDFRLNELTTTAEVDISQPSIGVYYKFSKIGWKHK